MQDSQQEQQTATSGHLGLNANFNKMAIMSLDRQQFQFPPSRLDPLKNINPRLITSHLHNSHIIVETGHSNRPVAVIPSEHLEQDA